MAVLIKPLPASFTAGGFVTPELARRGVGKKLRRLMICSEGKPDTGKTEWLLTCPGPGQILALDRGFDAVFDNQNPPPTRRNDFGIKVITAPTATQLPLGPANNPGVNFLPHWQSFYKSYLDSLTNPDSLTIGLDGYNVVWEIQRLAEHGKLTGVFPQTKYTDVYAAHRAMLYRAWDSGKIIVATCMVKDTWREVLDAKGQVVLDKEGQPKREPTGDYEAQGFPDQNYLWQIRIRHLFRPPMLHPITKKVIPSQWGIRVMKCKANAEMVGEELWGDSNNFLGLVSLVYPHIDPKDWGL